VILLTVNPNTLFIERATNNKIYKLNCFYSSKSKFGAKLERKQNEKNGRWENGTLLGCFDLIGGV